MKQTPEWETLRRTIERIERGSVRPVAASRFASGAPSLDQSLGGGFQRGALHEVFADGMANEPASSAFALGLAIRASGDRPIIWVRQDMVGLDMGEIYPHGLAEFGLSPERLILVRARDGPSVLRAGEEAARCSALGAVLVEPWGNPKTLDLVATRRFALAAARSGLPVLMVRAGGTPTPSAATTRWSISSGLSRSLEAEAPGHPCFVARLLRDRAGAPAREWILEWNRDHLNFNVLASLRATLPRDLAAVPAGGPHHASEGRRRAG
jgi:protein ImuA